MSKVDKGIPMPDAQPGRPPKYPWTTMAVGESFVLPAPNIASARAHCNGANTRYEGRKFLCRFYKGEIRVWRTK